MYLHYFILTLFYITRSLCMENLNRKEMNNIENVTEKRSTIKYDGTTVQDLVLSQQKLCRTSQPVLKRHLSRVEEERPLPKLNVSRGSVRKDQFSGFSGNDSATKQKKDQVESFNTNEKETSIGKTSAKYALKNSKSPSKNGILYKKHSEDSTSAHTSFAKTKKPSGYSLVQLGRRNSTRPAFNSGEYDSCTQRSLNIRHQILGDASSSSSDTVSDSNSESKSQKTSISIENVHTSKSNNKDEGFAFDSNILGTDDEITLQERESQPNRFTKRVSLSYPPPSIPTNFNHFKMQRTLFDSISAATGRSAETVKTNNDIDVTSASKYVIDESLEQQQAQETQDVSKVGLVSDQYALDLSVAFKDNITSVSKYGIGEDYDNAETFQNISKVGVVSSLCALSDDKVREETSPSKSVSYANKFSETDGKSCECWKICTCKGKNDSSGNEIGFPTPVSTSGYTQHTITIVTNNVPPNNYMANYSYGFNNSTIQGPKP